MGVAWAVPGPDESPRRGSRGGEGEECCSAIGGWDGTQGAQSGFGEVRGHEKFFFFLFCAGHGSPGRLHYGLHGGCVQQWKNLQLQSTGSCKTEKKERKRLRDIKRGRIYNVLSSTV